MESFPIKWRKSTKKDLRRISQVEVSKIVAAVSSLSDDPRPEGCKKMQGSDCAYRIRVGDYRVIYEVYEDQIIIEIIRVRHRREVYRKK
ncbi:type II toxin-antitoxin system RelE/ParE family toxin [Verrucomicrobiaceae bacterium N1E253]|uniref:Type II toxin-antitoxin system RelE/ParE family toxin n=1 Tax=Oceaniferula marina TaxID=2748318 RepID=A0A851GE53_9BACT|nr:type II toxin-antitoxin system RelE/ParE family toxin [Oceaniferula marina]